MTAVRIYSVVDIAVIDANKSRLLQTLRHIVNRHANEEVVLFLKTLQMDSLFK